MYLEELNEKARMLLRIADDPYATPESIQEAFFSAKRTLERLPERRDFRKDLKIITRMSEQSDAEFREIIGAYESFLIFLIDEQDLLIRHGLPIRLVLALNSQAETLRSALSEQSFSEQEVIDSIVRLASKLDEASSVMDLKAFDRQLAMRGSQGFLGLSTIGINAKCAPSEFVLPGGSILASGVLGLWLAKDCTSERPLLDRLNRVFRRRR